MTDANEATSRINEHLADELEKAQRELSSALAMLGRPVTVNVTSPDASTLQKVGEYLPQLTYLSTNASQIASAIQNSGSTLHLIANRLDDQNKLMERVAVALEGRGNESPLA